jgi:Ca2+-binding EF-hand superfamily protein
VFDDDGSGGVSPEELRIALSQFGILLNRKETRKLISVVDENGDGELQYSELLALVDAVHVDESKRLEKKRAEDAIAAQEEARRKRREQKSLDKSQRRAAAAAAGASASQFFKFSNASEELSEELSDDDNDDGDDGDADDVGEASLNRRRARAGLSLEEVAEDYVDKLTQDGAPDAAFPTAPLFLVVKRCLDAFLRQEAANAERLLAYYRAHDDNKDGNLDWKEFVKLVDAMNERSGMKMKMSPEESGECYMEASRITTESVRVDDQKFLLAMMVKGIVAPEIRKTEFKL